MPADNNDKEEKKTSKISSSTSLAFTRLESPQILRKPIIYNLHSTTIVPQPPTAKEVINDVFTVENIEQKVKYSQQFKTVVLKPVEARELGTSTFVEEDKLGQETDMSFSAAPMTREFKISQHNDIDPQLKEINYGILVEEPEQVLAVMEDTDEIANELKVELIDSEAEAASPSNTSSHSGQMFGSSLDIKREGSPDLSSDMESPRSDSFSRPRGR